MCCALLLTKLFTPAPLVAQDVKVLVLDALNGKPQKGAEVHYFCQGLHHNFPEDSDVTNSEGLVTITYTCKDDEEIDIWVTALPKEECGSEAVLTLKEILSVGIINPPDGVGQMGCPTKISKKLKPVPGQVIIFIKKPSWLQAHFGR
jgi:hypothetical protein